MVFSMIFSPYRDIFIEYDGGIMKKLLIVSVSFLFVAGFISMAWAHGPKGSNSGFRSHGYSKPHFSRPSHPQKKLHHNPQLRHKSVKRHQRHHRNFRHYRYYSPYYSPFITPYGYDYGYGGGYGYGGYGYGGYGYGGGYGYRDSPPREEPRQVPQHTPSSRVYYNNNPEPWFLYGKGKEFRQMGLIPPLSQASQGLK